MKLEVIALMRAEAHLHNSNVGGNINIENNVSTSHISNENPRSGSLPEPVGRVGRSEDEISSKFLSFEDREVEKLKILILREKLICKSLNRNIDF